MLWPKPLLNMALKQGAAAAEVRLQSESRSHPVFFEANRLKQLDSSTSLGTALRLWIDGRPGPGSGLWQCRSATYVEKAIAIQCPSTIQKPIEMTAGKAPRIPLTWAGCLQSNELT